MEAVDNAADRKGMRKILNLLGFKSMESGGPEPVRLKNLTEMAGEEISNEIVQLQGRGAITLAEDRKGK